MKWKNRAYAVITCLLVLFFHPVLGASTQNTVHIAVAANFAQPLKALAEEFQSKTNIKPIITVGSSGALYAQIVHGAPFDVFLSADTARPEALINNNKADRQNLKPYARGKLALVYHGTKVSTVAEFFKHNDSAVVAIANPRLAPYGSAAQSVINQFDENKKRRFVKGQNVLQAMQYFQTAHVDAAFVSLSLAMQSDANYLIPPPHWYAPIVQSMVIVKGAEHPYAARRFMQFLLSNDVQSRLKNWGYGAVKNQQGVYVGH